MILEGQTSIDEDESSDLKLPHITNLGELNVWESRNIRMAESWAFNNRQRDILDDLFLKELHLRMFGDVWKWAGKYRKTNKNIGVDKHCIAVEVKNLIEDTRIWLASHTFEEDELAIRFHHRLVFIHPFPNGNGRHARLMTDLLVAKKLNSPLFTWGSMPRVDSETQTRGAYIQALRLADKGDFGPLMRFVRT